MNLKPKYSPPKVTTLDEKESYLGGGLSAQCESGSAPRQNCFDGNNAVFGSCDAGTKADIGN